MNKGAYFILSILIIAIGWMVYRVQSPSPTDVTYSSGEWLFRFDYPTTYVLSQENISSETRPAILLSLEPADVYVPEYSDGPAGISIAIFGNGQRQMVEQFVKTEAMSNFDLGPMVIMPHTVANQAGIEYTWSGLYEGRTVAVATADFIYLFSVSAQQANDPLMRDFEHLLSTVQFGTL